MVIEDPRSGPVDELVDDALAVADVDDDQYWLIVGELQRRGDGATLDAMVGLCASGSERSQQLGLVVLGQLGYQSGRPFLEESLPVVLTLCGPDRSDDVLVDGIVALGYLADPRGLDAMIAVSSHPSDDVREAVASSLPAVAGDPPDARAIDALLRLARDDATDVRDWATFALGSQIDTDNAAIRDALAAAAQDDEGDIAGEALVGLAARGDPRALPQVASRLEQPDVGNLIVEAAALLADPTLLPSLYALRAASWDEGDPRGSWLADAITACESAGHLDS